jgi:HPt (histidine-containing phosphotransfer) domain-containing protein
MAVACRRSKPLDCKRLLEDCDDETSFANRCLQVFVRDTEADIDSIAAALGRNDFPRVAGLAHRIRIASASIRARFLQKEAAQLHVFCREGREEESMHCFARLRVEFDSFKRFIAALPPLPD